MKISKSVNDPVFVKVGAHDGITGDPCTDILIANSKWKGLLIEPVPFLFERLAMNFNDPSRFYLEKVAVSDCSGLMRFYFIDKTAIKYIHNLPPWFDQIGSFSKDHIICQLGSRVGPFIREINVTVERLCDILKRRNINKIDLLHIDAEGFDFKILKTAEISRFSPKIIFVEHKHIKPIPKIEMRRFLRSFGYTVYDCGNDYFALNSEIKI